MNKCCDREVSRVLDVILKIQGMQRIETFTCVKCKRTIRGLDAVDEHTACLGHHEFKTDDIKGTLLVG